MELLEALAHGKKGRATIVQLHAPYVAVLGEQIPVGEGIVARLVDRLRFTSEDASLVHSLVGDAVVTTDLAAAEALRREAPQMTVVTLDGTVLHPDGRVSGGRPGREMAAGMLSSNREMRELGEEVQRLDAVASERLAHHQSLRGAIGETQGALDRARQQKRIATNFQLVTAEKDLRASQQQLDSTRRRLETLCAEMEDLSSQLSEAGHERDEAQRVLDDARAILDEHNTGLGEAEGIAASWREQLDARRGVVTERKVRRAGARENARCCEQGHFNVWRGAPKSWASAPDASTRSSTPEPAPWGRRRRSWSPTWSSSNWRSTPNERRPQRSPTPEASPTGSERSWESVRDT